MTFPSRRGVCHSALALFLSSSALLFGCSSDGGSGDSDDSSSEECKKGTEGCRCDSKKCDGDLVCNSGTCEEDADSDGAGGGSSEDDDGDGGESSTGGSSSSSLRCVGTPTASCSDDACDVVHGCDVKEDSSCEGTADACSGSDGNYQECIRKWGCEFTPEGDCFAEATSCDDAGSAETCEERFEGCTWNGSYCTGNIDNDCDGVRESTCTANWACGWTEINTDYCQGEATACDKMEPQDCERQMGCSIVPAECKGEATPCEEMPLDECITQPGCGVKTSSGVTTAENEATGAEFARADLVPSVFELYRAPRNDTIDLYLDYAEINRGKAPSTAHIVTFVLSKDEEIGNDDDKVIHTVDFDGAIQPYGVNVWTVDGFLTMSDLEAEFENGFYYAGVIVDSDEQVAEYDEENNIVLLSTQVYIGPKTFDMVTVEASHNLTAAAAPGDVASVSALIRNSSTEAVETIPVSVFLSSDGTWDEADVELCAETLELPLDLGEEGNVQLECALPRARGEFQLLVVTDPMDTLVDANPADNVASAGGVTIAAPSPDLIVSAATTTPDSADWGEGLAVSATVENIGVDPSGTTSVSFYLSEDDAFSSSVDDLICTVSVANLDAGLSAVVENDCSLPKEALPASYNLIAVADSGNDLFEADDANNVFLSASTVTVTQPPFNFEAINVNLPSSPYRGVGENLAFGARVDNAPGGAIATPSTTILVVLSTDTSITEDDIVIDTVSLGSIQPGENQLELSFNVPDIALGAYYVGIIYDPENLIPETSESDNTAYDTDQLIIE